MTPKYVAITSTRNFPLFLGGEDGKSWRAEMSQGLRELLAGMEREVLLLRGYTKDGIFFLKGEKEGKSMSNQLPIFLAASSCL